VNGKTHSISLFAGHPCAGYKGDGGPATSAWLYDPSWLAFDAANNLYVVDFTNQVIRKISNSGIITTVVGNSTVGYSGDGGPATKATLHYPQGLAIDKQGKFLHLATFVHVPFLC
jgi:hypothetical protein